MCSKLDRCAHQYILLLDLHRGDAQHQHGTAAASTDVNSSPLTAVHTITRSTNDKCPASAQQQQQFWAKKSA